VCNEGCCAELAVRVREDVSKLQEMTPTQRETVGMPIEDKVRVVGTRFAIAGFMHVRCRR
jgi:hypothetical protein